MAENNYPYKTPPYEPNREERAYMGPLTDPEPSESIFPKKRDKAEPYTPGGDTSVRPPSPSIRPGHARAVDGTLVFMNPKTPFTWRRELQMLNKPASTPLTGGDIAAAYEAAPATSTVHEAVPLQASTERSMLEPFSINPYLSTYLHAFSEQASQLQLTPETQKDASINPASLELFHLAAEHFMRLNLPLPEIPSSQRSGLAARYENASHQAQAVLDAIIARVAQGGFVNNEALLDAAENVLTRYVESLPDDEFYELPQTTQDCYSNDETFEPDNKTKLLGALAAARHDIGISSQTLDDIALATEGPSADTIPAGVGTTDTAPREAAISADPIDASASSHVESENPLTRGLDHLDETISQIGDLPIEQETALKTCLDTKTVVFLHTAARELYRLGIPVNFEEPLLLPHIPNSSLARQYQIGIERANAIVEAAAHIPELDVLFEDVAKTQRNAGLKIAVTKRQGLTLLRTDLNYSYSLILLQKVAQAENSPQARRKSA